MNEIRYLYIMGRGNSGSTMLDIVLGNSKNLVSTGELVAGIINKSGKCGCGENFEMCSFWTSVRKTYTALSGRDWFLDGKKVRSQANIKALIPTLIYKSSNNRFQELIKIQNDLTEVIIQSSEKNCVVDSSKEFTRALFLTRFSSNYKTIHLIKNPLDIIASKFFRLSTGTPFRFLRTNFNGPIFIFIILNSITWTIGNLIGEFIKIIDKENCLSLRFEDLIVDPRFQIERISEHIGIDLSDVLNKIDNNEEFFINHNLGGNRIKAADSIKLKKGSELKRPSRWYHKLIVYIFCWPLMIKYNYL